MTGTTASLASRRAGRRRFSLTRPSWTLPAMLFLVLFFVVPVAETVRRSLFDGQAASNGHLFYYIKLLTDSYYGFILFQTLAVSSVVTLLCLCVGYPAAYFLVRYGGRWRGAIIFFLITPLLTSIIMRTFGWRVLFARMGLLNAVLLHVGLLSRPIDLLNSSVSVYVGLVHVWLPFMVLSISSVLQTIGVNLEEAAQALGATRLKAFTSVVLPLSLDGIITGCILVFMLTNGSFVTMLLLGGGRIVTIPLLIYQQFNLTQDVDFAGAMGTVLLVLALICLVVQTWLLRSRSVG